MAITAYYSVHLDILEFVFLFIEKDTFKCFARYLPTLNSVLIPFMLNRMKLDYIYIEQRWAKSMYTQITTFPFYCSNATFNQSLTFKFKLHPFRIHYFTELGKVNPYSCPEKRTFLDTCYTVFLPETYLSHVSESC